MVRCSLFVNYSTFVGNSCVERDRAKTYFNAHVGTWRGLHRSIKINTACVHVLKYNQDIKSIHI